MRMMFDRNRTECFVRNRNAVTLGCITPARWFAKVPAKEFVYLKYCVLAAEAFCFGEWSFAASS